MLQCPNCKTKLEFEGSTSIRARNRRANVPTSILRKCNRCNREFETVEVLKREYYFLKTLEVFLTTMKVDLKDIVEKIEDYEREKPE